MSRERPSVRGVRHAQALALRSATVERPHITRVHWDVSGRCQSPVFVERVARPDARGLERVVAVPRDGYLATMQYLVPCRVCPPCLKARSRHWRERASSETGVTALMGMRTWFVTLTLSPEQRIVFTYRAAKRARLRGEDYDDLSPRRRFQMLNDAVSPEITKWLKRVRKGRKVKRWNSETKEFEMVQEPVVRFRYLVIAEEHEDGFPHWHLLIHETDTVLKDRMRREWFPRFGFTDFRLVKEGRHAAYYVTKYATKSALARVRASVNYGNGLTP